jgi:hypothetical protein
VKNAIEAPFKMFALWNREWVSSVPHVHSLGIPISSPNLYAKKGVGKRFPSSRPISSTHKLMLLRLVVATPFPPRHIRVGQV